MKRAILLLLSLLCLVPAAKAQLLWEISGNGLEKPSYLFGTHHIAPLSICDSIAGFEAAFASCNQLYGEIILDNMEALALQLAPMMMAPPDSSLSDLLTPEAYQKIDSLVSRELGIPLQQFNAMKPSLIASQLAIVASMKVFDNYDQQTQLDATLQNRAKAQGMQIGAFETPLSQMELLFGAPLDEQAESLAELADNYDKLADYSISLCNHYMDQDLTGMIRIMEDPEMGSDEEEMNRLIFDRNKDWAQQLKSVLPANPVFIVVGAGHLPLQSGLIQLLRDQGYTLTPVN